MEELGTEYDSLIDEIERIRLTNVGVDAMEGMSGAMDAVDQLVKGATKPEVVGMDARALELTTGTVKQNAEKLGCPFNLLEFGDKLVSMLSSSARDNTEESVWGGLTEYTQKMIRPRPAFDYMCGTYDHQGFKPKERPQRSTQKDFTKELVTALSQENAKKGDTVLGQQEILDKILTLIRKTFKANGNKPVNYFPFILNPDSFEETCQNILNVGFLIRDSFVEMFEDDHELFIAPYKPNRNETDGVSKEEAKRQMVIQLDKEDWKDFVALYHVTKPVIDFGLNAHDKPSKT